VNQTFPSRVEPWLTLSLALTPLTLIAIAATLWSGEPELVARIWAAALLLSLLFFAMLWPVRYEVGPDAVLVKFGRFHGRIRFDEMTTIQRSPDFVSRALSLNRLRILRDGKRRALLSPEDEVAFTRAIQQRAPHVAIDPLVASGEAASLGYPRG
jgi:hypothetical protein